MGGVFELFSGVAVNACVLRNSTELCTRLGLGNEPVDPAASLALVSCCWRRKAMVLARLGVWSSISWELIDSLEVVGEPVDKLLREEFLDCMV